MKLCLIMVLLGFAVACSTGGGDDENKDLTRAETEYLQAMQNWHDSWNRAITSSERRDRLSKLSKINSPRRFSQDHRDYFDAHALYATAINLSDNLTFLEQEEFRRAGDPHIPSCFSMLLGTLGTSPQFRQACTVETLASRSLAAKRSEWEFGLFKMVSR